MRLVFGLEKVGYDGGHHAAHHPVCHFDDAYIVSQLPGNRSDFEADIAGTYDDDLPGRIEICADARDIIDATQVVNAFQVASRHIDTPHTRARRQDKRVIGNVLAGGGDNRTLVAVDCGDPGFQADVDIGRIVKVSGFDVEALCRQFPGQEFFRERRALVRQPGLFADEHDTAVEAFLPQRGHDLSGSVTGSGNYESVCQGTLPLSTFQTGCSGQKNGNNIITAMNTTMVSGTPTLR